MKATRREAMLGALAVPAVAGMPACARHRAAARPRPRARRRPPLAGRTPARCCLEGDRIRFARAVFERHPSLVSA